MCVFPVTERKDIVAMDLDINFYQSVVFLINKDRLQDSAFLSVIETLKRE